MQTDEFLTTAQAAELAGVHPRVLRDWVQRGRVTGERQMNVFQRPYRFARAEIERVIAHRDGLMTTPQAARLIGIKPVTLRKYVRTGRAVPTETLVPRGEQPRYYWSEADVRAQFAAQIAAQHTEPCPTCDGTGVIAVEVVE